MGKICYFCNKDLVWPEINSCAYCDNYFCEDHRIAEKHECSRVLAAKHIEKDYLRRRGVNITRGSFQSVCKNCGFESRFTDIESANEERVNHIQSNNCPSNLVSLKQSEESKQDDTEFVRRK